MVASAVLMALAVPVNVIVVSLVPSPVVNDKAGGRGQRERPVRDADRHLERLRSARRISIDIAHRHDR